MPLPDFQILTDSDILNIILLLNLFVAHMKT